MNYPVGQAPWEVQDQTQNTQPPQTGVATSATPQSFAVGKAPWEAQPQTQTPDPNAYLQNVVQKYSKKTPDYSSTGGFVANEFLGAGPVQDRGFLGSLVQNTYGSKGLVGAAQLPGRAVAAGIAGNAALSMAESTKGLQDMQEKLVQQAQIETDPTKKAEIVKQYRANADLIAQSYQNANASGLQDYNLTVGQIAGTAGNAALTALTGGVPGLGASKGAAGALVDTFAQGKGLLTKTAAETAAGNLFGQGAQQAVAKTLAWGKNFIPRVAEGAGLGAAFTGSSNVYEGKPVTQGMATGAALGGGLVAATSGIGTGIDWAKKLFNPEVDNLAQSAIKPTGSAKMNWQKKAPVAMEEMTNTLLDNQKTGKGITKVTNLSDAVDLGTQTMKNIWADVQAIASPNKDILINQNGEIADNLSKLITDRMVIEGSPEVDLIRKYQQIYSKPLTAAQGESVLRDLNAELGSLYAKTPSARYTQLTGNAAKGVDYEIAAALRTQLDDAFANATKGSAKYGDLNKAYGAVKEFTDQARNRAASQGNLSLRSLPEQLQTAEGIVRGAGKLAEGKPVQALIEAGRPVAAKFIKRLDTSDNKIAEAFNQYIESTKTAKGSPLHNRFFGPVKQAVTPKEQTATQAVKSGVGKVTDYLKEPKLGMSIQDVSKVKAIDEATKKELVQLLDYARIGEIPKGMTANTMERSLANVAEKYGINLDKPNTKVADQIENLISKTKTMDKLPGTKLNK